ncbi:MAG: hypothetical protein WC729_26185 [Sphingomonas sp.]|uniref:hypothetical protein n=1 Tax=Sphingomonas sp. TaxID=28214 RepID=UPI003567F0B1
MTVRFSPAVAIPLALLAAAACVLSAADRSIKAGLPFPALLSRPSLGAVAARRDSLAALQAADFPRAEALARVAVARDPGQQQSAALLGAARLGRHATDAALQAFLVAGALGWRDPITQLYWLDYAQTVGDFDMVAQRVDALRRTQNNAAAVPALEALESSNEGRASLAKRLALDPPWRDQYILESGTLSSDQAVNGRVASLQRAKMAGMPADCGIVAGAARLLVNGKRHAAAATLWRSLCVPSASATSALMDGGFRDVPTNREASPFEWTLMASGAIEAHVDSLPAPLAGKGLFARSTSSVREPIARKWLALAPGHYILSWSASAENRAAGGPFSVSFSCPDVPARSPLESVPIGRGRYASSISVPATACSIQLLKILVEPSSNGSGAASISDLRIASKP